MCLEVLEHVKPPECIRIIKQCLSVCKPGGYLLFSVPNIFVPEHYLEFTHETFISYADLPALMNWSGINVLDGSRWFIEASKRRLLYRYILYPLHRAIGKDFCNSILMLGRKPLEHE